ncbi:MAG: hypothetical protein QOK16_917 [Solirubrobacteraceae bacterium]|nr:hypothetical protein [Solirubrobacteraceae bacterium]
MTRICSRVGLVGRRRSSLALAITTLAVAATAIASTVSTAAFAPQAGQRVDMKVLLLANAASDPDITAWEDSLKREGTLYDRINATAAALTPATFAAGERAKYQGVIVAGANGTLASGRPDGFSDAEWTLLRAFEKKFAIRQLNVNAVPGPPLGLAFATTTGQLDGSSSLLTAQGLAQFENLAGTVPFENLDAGVLETNGYGAVPCVATDTACAAASYETLLRGSGGVFDNASLVGIATMKDEREEMNATFSANQFQVHSQTLRHAMLSWVTGGVFIGRDRSYLSVDVDDIFLPNDRWNASLNTTPELPGQLGQQDLRMTAADVQRLVDFQNTNNVTFNLLFNAAGVGDAGGPSEPLTAALLASKAQFTWINHTFTHADLTSASQSTIVAEIEQNTQFAQANGLPYNPAVLVTGGHTGIGTSSPVTAPNPNMALALNALGVTSVGADNSREVGQRQLGSALTLPRYPTNVYYNVSTWADQLDEYDWLYLSSTAAPPGRGNCTNSATTTCFSTPVTQAEFIDREASAVVRHMLGNDPRPHYAHQTNIMSGSAEPDVPVGTGVNNRGDGILYSVIGEALKRYRTFFKVPFEQPGMVALTQEMQRQAAWSRTTEAQVNGYIQDGKVTLASTVSGDVPITGTTVGDVYGGQRSGWLAVTSATKTIDVEEPRNTVAPDISGANTVGSTLTATAGTFTGTPAPAITSRQWQRRTIAGGAADGPWTSIPGATSATYLVTVTDLGRQLRFVTTAANRRSTWGMGFSAPVEVPDPNAAKPAPVGGSAGATVPPVGTAAPVRGTPGATAPPADTSSAVGPAPSVKRSAPAPAAFTCKVKRGAWVSVSCVVRNSSGRLRSARIRALRGTHVLGTASGRVRSGNRVPTLRIKPAVLRQGRRVTIRITVRLASGRTRNMSRALKL